MVLQELPKIVTIHVDGLKSVCRMPIERKARLNVTWLDFLNNSCNLGIRLDQGIQVCTTSYSPNTGRGWNETDLTQPIRSFLEKFSLKKNKYSVRLQFIRPKDRQSSTARNSSRPGTPLLYNVPLRTSSPASCSQFVRSATPVPPPLTPRPGDSRSKERISTASSRIPFDKMPATTTSTYTRPSSSPYPGNKSVAQHLFRGMDMEETFKIPNENSRPQQHFTLENINGELLDVITVESDEDDEIAAMNMDRDDDLLNGFDSDDDVESQLTAADNQEDEARGKGVMIERLSPELRRNLQAMSNNFFLRVRAEMRRMKQKNLWSRQFQRAPLMHHFVEQLFGKMK